MRSRHGTTWESGSPPSATGCRTSTASPVRASEPDAAETQRKLQETAKEVGDQLSRAFDALGATIRDEEAKADLKQALNAFGDALGATFDEAGHAIRRTVGSSGETPPAKPDDPPAGPANDG